MTTDRQIEVVARALWDLHKTEMGDVWYEQNNITIEAKNSFRKEAIVAIEASYAKYIPMLVEVLKYYADEAAYWNVTDGGKCYEATNADQGELAREALSKLPPELRGE